MKVIVLLILVFSSLNTHSFDFKKILDPNDLRTLKYGYSPSFGLYSADDPDGETEMAMDVVVLNGFATMNYRKKGRRLWLDAGYQYWELEAGNKTIGQLISRYKIALSLQRHMKMSGMMFWVGGGAGLIWEIADSRHTIDSDGFLAESYDKRSTIDIVFVGTAQMPLFKFKAVVPVEFGVSSQIELLAQTLKPSISMGATFLF